MPHFDYGLKAQGIKEKELETSINRIFEQMITNGEHNVYKNNKLKKQKPRGGVTSLDPDVKQYRYDYTYLYTNKYWGFSCELYPNTDKYNNVKFKDADVNWVLWISFWINHVEWDEEGKSHVVETVNPACAVLRDEIMKTLPCEVVLLKEYQDGEERL